MPVVDPNQHDLELEAWFLRRMEGGCWKGHVARMLARHRMLGSADTLAAKQAQEVMNPKSGSAVCGTDYSVWNGPRSL